MATTAPLTTRIIRDRPELPRWWVRISISKQLTSPVGLEDSGCRSRRPSFCLSLPRWCCWSHLVPLFSTSWLVASSSAPGAGFVSSLGLSVGGLVHVLAATLGLSAILVSSATAFGIVKLIGAGYLVYLGLRTMLSRDDAEVGVSESPRGMWRIYRDGVIVNLFNPKAALFFFAFLPQFVDPARGNVALQFLGLGLLFEALGLMSDSTYALLAG